MISRNSTHFVLISLILCQQNQNIFYFAAIDIQAEISLEIERKYVPGSNAFDPKRFYKKQVSKRLSNLRDPSKKVGSKVVHFYCMKSYRDWPQIEDPQILTVGNPIESNDA